jgi:hypothetical protein
MGSHLARCPVRAAPATGPAPTIATDADVQVPALRPVPVVGLIRGQPTDFPAVVTGRPRNHDGSVAQIRRALDNKILAGYARTGSSVGGIAQAVNSYNNGIRGKSLKVRLAELHAIEHSVYEWFGDQHMPDFAENPTALKLKTLLTAIQEEQESLVARTVNDPQADPPVANFDDLSGKEQARVRGIWTDLVSGTGNIRITETQDYQSTTGGGMQQMQHVGFRIQVLTSFARLLTAEFGRQLVAEVNKSTGGTNLVTVRPGLAKAVGDVPAEELVASAESSGGATLQEFTEDSWFGKMQKGSKRWKVRKRQLDRLYPLADLDPSQDEVSRMSFMHRARSMPLRGGGMTEGFSVVDNGQRRYYRFGAGSSSTITYPADLRDGSDDPMSRYVDEAGNEIIVPVFIALGHELGHALHSLQGAQSGEAQSLEPIAAAGINPAEYSGTLEEIVTIRGVENRLREEHGITERHSHHNVISLTCKRIAEGPVGQAYKDVAKLPLPMRGGLLQMLKTVDSCLGSRDVKGAKRALAAALKALKAAQAQAAQAQQQVAPTNPQQTSNWFADLFSGFFAKQ